MNRIIVVGMSGSGKTTLAQAIAAKRDIKHIEMDAIRHLPNWRPNPDFKRDLHQATQSAAQWVADGNYRGSGSLEAAWPLADTIIWLNMPLSLCLWRVTWRSLGRAIRRTELWNGNRETLTNLFFSKESMPYWVWTRHAIVRRDYQKMMRENRFPHLTWICLDSPTAVQQWLATLDPETIDT